MDSGEDRGERQGVDRKLFIPSGSWRGGGWKGLLIVDLSFLMWWPI